jgi:prophage regulatory protein
MNEESTSKITLLTARALAGLLSVSRRQVFRLNSAGKLPAPIRIGGVVRWSAQQISDWLSAGAPDRKTWESIKEQSNGH